MKQVLALIFAASAFAGSGAAASEFPKTALLAIGYEEAKLADFAGTPRYRQRLGDPSGFLAVSADFNGDGKSDEARILFHRERGEAYVVATILTDKLDTYVMAPMAIDKASEVGIRLAPPSPGTRLAGISIFKLDGSAESLEYFDGEEFVTR